MRLKYKKKYNITNTSQTKTPNTEFNKAILRPVIIQTEPQTIRVKIKKRRNPSGIMSIFSSFLKTFMIGGNGEKLIIKDNIVPIVENISAKSTILRYIIVEIKLE